MIKYEEIKKNHRLTDYEATKETIIENYIKPNTLRENKKIQKTQQKRFMHK